MMARLLIVHGPKEIWSVFDKGMCSAIMNMSYIRNHKYDPLIKCARYRILWYLGLASIRLHFLLLSFGLQTILENLNCSDPYS